MSRIVFIFFIISCISVKGFSGNFVHSFPFNDPPYSIVKIKNKEGLANAKGDILIPPRYDALGWSKGDDSVINKVIGYKKSEKWGILHIRNKPLTQPLYSDLYAYKERLFFAALPGKDQYGIINHRGKSILPFRYQELKPAYDEILIAANKEGRFALIQEDGKPITPFEFRDIQVLNKNLLGVTNDRGKVALMDKEGIRLSEFKYDSIAPFQNKWALTFDKNRMGIIDQNGQGETANRYKRIHKRENDQIVLDPYTRWQVLDGENKRINTFYYDHLRPFGKNLFEVKAGSYQNLIQISGQPLLNGEFKPVAFNNGLITVKQGKYSGIVKKINDSLQIIIPPRYDSVKVTNHLIQVAEARESKDESHWKWALFNAQGQKLTGFVYQQMLPATRELFRIKCKDQWGYLNNKGDEVIECRFSEAKPFIEGRAVVAISGRGKGVIDEAGEWIIKPASEGKFTKIKDTGKNIFIYKIKKDDKGIAYGLMDFSGKKIYESAHFLIHNGSGFWEKNSQENYGLINYEGERLLKTNYDTISSLQDDSLYTFTKRGKTGIIGKSGKLLVGMKNEYEEVLPYREKRLAVKINGKYGAIDAEGRLLIANQYEEFSSFQEGLAKVKIAGRWGFINKKERLIIQPEFEEATSFRNGLAIVGNKGKYGIMNKAGEIIIPVKHDTIYTNEFGRFINVLASTSKTRGKAMGLISPEGKPLISPKYDTVQDLPNDYVIISRNGKYGLVNKDGVSTIPLKYEKLIYDNYNNLFLVPLENGPKILNFGLSGKKGGDQN